MWQAARGAEAHQCWPPMVTSSTNIMNVYIYKLEGARESAYLRQVNF